ASFCDKKISINPIQQRIIKEKLQNFSSVFPAENNKQAMYIEDSKIISNPIGTAPGFYLKKSDKLIAAFPGVPTELDKMLDDFLSKSGIKTQKKSEIHVLSVGLPESLIDQYFSEIGNPKISIGTIAGFGYVKLRISSESLSNNELQSIINNHINKNELIKRSLFCFEDKKSPEEVLVNRLIENKLSLSTAESCTGGMIGSLITSVSGASQVYWGGVISYANDAKQNLLKVPGEIITNKGAVSFECAEEMLKGISKISNTDISIAVTGIAGPGGGSREKPVGTVFIAMETRDYRAIYKFCYGTERNLFRRFTSYKVLSIINEYICFGNNYYEKWPSLQDAII
ncbi:MAG: nicotinamide-nucleotide amidohydrolase family protein, partial [Bacteroidetes bacterium]